MVWGAPFLLNAFCFYIMNKILYKHYVFLDTINSLIEKNLNKIKNINIIVNINHNNKGDLK